MRLSSSLLVVLAAIAAANAASVDSALNSQQRLARVHKGAAQVHALKTANVGANTVDLQKLQHLVAVAAKRSVEVSALAKADVKVEAANVKRVAGLVHKLTASLEAHAKVAAKVSTTKDHKKAAVQAKALFANVKSTLALAVADVSGVTSKTSATAAVLNQRDLLGSIDLSVVASLLTKVEGAEALLSIVAGLHVDAILRDDVFSILANVQLLTAIHDVVDIQVVLQAVLCLADSVEVLEALKELDNPTAFVEALVEIGSVVELVGAASAGVGAIAKVEGAAKLTAYVAQYGSVTVEKILCIAGVETVLEAIVKVSASVQLLASLKTVTDVTALVSGLHAVPSVVSLVASIQAVTNIVDLCAVFSAVGSVKRELPLGVEETVAGLGVGRVAQLKRALAHVAALPESALGSSVEKTAQTTAVDSAEQTVNGLDVAQLAVLKRSIADLSSLSTDEIAAIDAAVKRDLLGGLPLNTVSGLPLNTAGGMLGGVQPDLSSLDLGHVAQIKRDVLNTADSAVWGAGSVLNAPTSALSLVDLNRIVALKRSELLAPVMDTVSSLEVAQLVPALKRALADADVEALPGFLVKGSRIGTTAVARRTASVGAEAEISISIDLLDDALETLLDDIKELLCKLTEIIDELHVEVLVGEIKNCIAPLVQTIALVVSSSLNVKTPSIDVKLEAIAQLAAKTVKSLP